MKINEVAKLVNISVRTLHYYDEIDLLKPKKINLSGYRIYDEDNLKKLQQIMFLREIDFSLKQIKAILDDKNYDYDAGFIKHKEILEAKRDRLNNLIKLIDKHIQGDTKMSFEEFDMKEIESMKTKYEKEVKEKWGNSQSYKQSIKRTKTYTKREWEIINEENKDIFKAFASIKDDDPKCDQAQKLVVRWKDFINKYFYDCDNEMLYSLSKLYTDDERFKKNIDKFGENTASFMAEAIQYFCK